jgi:hypothetical protein
MQGKLDIYGAFFTSGEAARIAGISDNTFGVWLLRGHVRAAREERKTSKRRRPRGGRLFSVVTIFEAKIVRQLVENLAITPSEATKIAQIAAAGDWKQQVISGLPSSPPPISLLVSRVAEHWQVIDYRAEVGGIPVRREEDSSAAIDAMTKSPFAVLPVALPLAFVYQHCLQFLTGSDQSMP